MQSSSTTSRSWKTYIYFVSVNETWRIPAQPLIFCLLRSWWNSIITQRDKKWLRLFIQRMHAACWLAGDVLWYVSMSIITCALLVRRLKQTPMFNFTCAVVNLSWPLISASPSFHTILPLVGAYSVQCIVVRYVPYKQPYKRTDRWLDPRPSTHSSFCLCFFRSFFSLCASV